MAEAIGKGIVAEVANGKLALVVNVGADFGITKSGKSVIVADSKGFAKVAGLDGYWLKMLIGKKLAA